jgi:hypothetical protein
MHDDFVATLGAEAPTHSMVTKYFCPAQFDLAKDPRNSSASSPHLANSHEAIVTALEEKWFSSIWQLARATHLPHMTAPRRLTNLLGFLPRALRWVPYLLSGAQSVRVQRVEVFSPVLLMLEIQIQEQRAWHDVTLQPWMSPGSVKALTMSSFGADPVNMLPRGHVCVSLFDAKN